MSEKTDTHENSYAKTTTTGDRKIITQPPFDLTNSVMRDHLVLKSGIDFAKHRTTLELHIYSPL